MNFFRSILSDEPDPPLTDDSEPQSPTKSADGDDSNENSPREDFAGDDAGEGGLWSFGGLMKTLATRSESVIETYRRDLQEFGSGLQKETEVIRDVASRAVKDLPTSIEAGASAAQGSLESVGNAIDGVWKSTAEIISHGKDALLAPSDGESDSEPLISTANNSFSSRKYSRFDAQLRLIQSDEKTYCDGSDDDLEEYNKWKLGFVLQDKSDEVLGLIEENGTIDEIYKRVVPNVVDHETFWCRYFYKVHKLKLQEDVRANLVKRAISVDDDEELTWDVDDDDEEEEKPGVVASKSNVVAAENKESSSEESPSPAVIAKESEVAEIEKKKPIVEDAEKVGVVEESSERSKDDDESNAEKDVSKPDEKAAAVVAASDAKGGDGGGSCKDSDVSIVSTQPSLPDEEDMGWDEIEDLGSHDEKKASDGGSPNKDEIRKRLSTAEDDEDLSWDIEDDDDEPTTTTTTTTTK